MTDRNEGPVHVRTIADMARLAGVSTGTVSRALSGSPLVKEHTREKIVALAREHGFTPNATARNLRMQRTGTIGVVIPLGHDRKQHLTDPFFVTMIGHLADRLSERGYDVLLSRVLPADSRWLGRIVDSGRVDGVILIGQSDQAAAIDEVAARYRPLVVWGASGAEMRHCSVGSDNVLGGTLAARHLIAQGCSRLAFVGNPVGPEIVQRLEGARLAAREAGLAHPLAVIPALMEPEAAHATISTWLDAQQERPDGLVCASDVLAMCALRVLAERGIAVPGDIRVTGYDDLMLAAQTVPPLTTVNQQIEDGAGHLVDLLLRRIAGEDAPGIVMPPRLVERASA